MKDPKKNSRGLEVVQDGFVCMYEFEQDYKGNKRMKCKGSTSFTVAGRDYVLCLDLSTNPKKWKDKKGRTPNYIINCAICSKESNTNTY